MPTRRIATAHLIDELSLGVSIITGRSRIATEIAHFFYAATGEHTLHRETELTLQKCFFDTMWDTSLSEIVATIGDNWVPERAALQVSARQINADIKAHADNLVSYQATYHDEIIGGLDVSTDLAADVMARLAERAGITPAEPGSPAWKECARMCRNLLIAAFKKPATKNTLRTIHAGASFHAGHRWDRYTNFTANHFYDFEHAAAAVSYCDAFFTEGFLAQIANAGHIRLCDLNSCHVTADVERAVEIVRDLNTSAKSN
jgi:hypothetical protein